MLHLKNGLTNCVQIWCAVRDLLDISFPLVQQVMLFTCARANLSLYLLSSVFFALTRSSPKKSFWLLSHGESTCYTLSRVQTQQCIHLVNDVVKP